MSESLLDAIIDGRLRPGERLPTRLELKRQYGDSSATIQAALDDLPQGAGDRALPTSRTATATSGSSLPR